MGCIYMLTCVPNGKNYIGKTTNEKSRIRQHLNGHSKECRALHNAINKYGKENFTVKILHDGIIPELLDSYEIEAIAKHNTIAPNGYNLKGGGSSGGFYSEETRNKMSDSKKGNTYTKGRKHTPETLAKISESLKGKTPWNKGIPRSTETRNKISVANSGRRHTKESCNKMGRGNKGKTTWNKGGVAHNRSPFYTPAYNFFVSLSADMHISEKRKTLKENFPGVPRYLIESWVRKWSGIITPNSSPKNPKYHEVYKEYVLLPSTLSIMQKRKHLYMAFPDINRSTILRWVKKWQPEP